MNIGQWTIPLFAIAVAVTFIIQWIVYVPCMIAKTEKYFDLTGSLTYVAITAGLLTLTADLGPRAAVLGSMVILWALRLGSFLFVRTWRAGKDDRFDELKTSKLRFLGVWTGQGLWITITASAAWIAISSGQRPGVDAFLVAGTLIWLLGFGIETAADLQKNRFKAEPSNRGRFIRTGLWSISRHPNYLGEIILWLGIAVAAFPALSGWGYAGLASPIFVILLLTKVSGIPLLESKAQAKWGQDVDYQDYRQHTAPLVPWVNFGRK